MAVVLHLGGRQRGGGRHHALKCVEFLLAGIFFLGEANIYAPKCCDVSQDGTRRHRVPGETARRFALAISMELWFDAFMFFFPLHLGSVPIPLDSYRHR